MASPVGKWRSYWKVLDWYEIIALFLSFVGVISVYFLLKHTYTEAYPEHHIFTSQWNPTARCRLVEDSGFRNEVKYAIEVTFPAPTKRSSTQGKEYVETIFVVDFGMSQMTSQVVYNATTSAERKWRRSFGYSKVFHELETEPHLMGEIQLKDVWTGDVAFAHRFPLYCPRHRLS